MTSSGAAHAAPASSGRAPLRLRITSDTANLAPARKLIERLASALGFDEREVGEIGLCVNEAFANVIRHAYGGVGDRPVQIDADPIDGGLEIRIRDWGSGVVPPPPPPEDPDPLSPGGLGLICLARMMTRCTFHPQPDGMLLVLQRLHRNDRPGGSMIQLKSGNQIVTSIRQQGDAVLATLRGEVDLHNSPLLRSALFDLLEQTGARRLILNLQQVPYVDSSAIAVLVETIRKLRDGGGRLFLTHLQPRVQSVMEVTRLGTLIGLAQTDDAALTMSHPLDR
jgi:anti-anti-sigma factor